MKKTLLVAMLLAAGCGSSTGSGGSGGSAGSGGESGMGGTPGVGGSGNGGESGTGGSVVRTENLVFVTASAQTANLGGFEGADAICAGEASAAGLEGEFKAWLSTLDTPAADRLTRSAVPYVLVDGTRVADDWDDLVDMQLLAPIGLDAGGQPQGGDVWTGTLPSGQPFADGDCAGFTTEASNSLSLCGSTAFSDSRWTASQTPTCNTRLRLFCFQQ
jgi:hypothetical protein